MRKYVLYEESVEVQRISQIVEGCTDLNTGDCKEEIKVFDSKDEALKELKNYDSSVSDYGRYYLVTEYYVEEEERDEDGEIIDCGFGVWAFSKLPDKYAKFYINEKSESAYSRKEYTFDEVKEFFKLEEDVELSDDEYNEICRQNEEIDACYDLDELIDVLTKQAGGMEFTYIIEKC